MDYKHYIQITEMINNEEEVTVSVVQNKLRVSEKEALSLLESLIEIEMISLEDSIDIIDDAGYAVQFDLASLRFAQFIMIESAIMNSRSSVVTAETILSAIIRPIGEDEIEDENTLKMRRELNGMEAEYLMPIFNEFHERRRRFHEKDFAGVFYKKKSNEKKDGEAEAEVSPEKKERERADKNYHWYNLLDDLASSDVTKHSEVLQLPMGLVAPKVAKDTVYRRLEFKEQKRMEAASRAKRR